ncbi:MAG: peptidyl-prolyl cis-trans isomerase A [Marinobacter sp. T13-3]|nr:MAG: peptidyl-prolyl cis-trans isomerase A [Marinobacter sp. T13-3]
MKKTFLAIAITGLVAGCTTAQQEPKNPPLETTAQKVSYGMGLVMGERMTNLQGIEHGHTGDDKTKRLSRDEIREALIAYQQEMQKKQQQELDEMARKNQEAGEAFLAKNAKREGVKTTESGLQYEIIEKGDGQSPTAKDEVRVHYTGKLLSGEVFDSSRERGQPVTFGLEQVIPGWTEGLQLMSEGARYKLYIPADLAYGAGGNQAIGPNETLIFDVELLAVNPGDE